MLRSFLPVGQGAFYIEQFDEHLNKRINVVYDCGSLSSKKTVQKEIESNFYEGEEILFVFISHLDADHVNGLEFLLNYCNVQNIIFPLIPRPDKYILSLKYLCQSNKNNVDDFTFKFISNPYDTIMSISESTRIFEIIDWRNDFENQQNIYDDASNYNITYLRSGENILDNVEFKSKDIRNLFWEYVPYNFRFKDRSREFIDILTERISGLKDYKKIFDINNIVEMWGNASVRYAIKSAYESVKGDINSNSLALFSGIQKTSIRQTWVRPLNILDFYLKTPFWEEICKNISKPNGCLYTGDYNARKNWEDLNIAFNKYWQYIGCVQVPHHGSKNNYDERIAKYNSFYVISAGENNNYGHPSGLVVKNLIANGKYPFIVTEQRKSEVIFNIRY